LLTTDKMAALGMTAVLVERESIQNTILDSGIDHNFSLSARE